MRVAFTDSGSTGVRVTSRFELATDEHKNHDQKKTEIEEEQERSLIFIPVSLLICVFCVHL